MEVNNITTAINRFGRGISNTVESFINQVPFIGSKSNKKEVTSPVDYSHIHRRKSRFELFRISAAVMGIEFCYAAETAFVSPTLLNIGFDHAHMTLIWCLSPLIGFFLTPILGSLSDRCHSPFGRRRPFILALSVGIILGLLLVPNGKNLGIAMGDSYSNNEENTSELNFQNLTIIGNSTVDNKTKVSIKNDHHPWSIFFTVIGTVLLDFDSDACQSPSRAYMLDVTVPEDHAIGLSTFTVMAGLGGSLGYAMGAINWETTTVGQLLGGHLRSVFTIIIFIYLGCVIVTIISFREIPLNILEATNIRQEKICHQFVVTKRKTNKKLNKRHSWTASGMCYEKFTNNDEDEDEDDDDHDYKNVKREEIHFIRDESEQCKKCCKQLKQHIVSHMDDDDSHYIDDRHQRNYGAISSSNVDSMETSFGQNTNVEEKMKKKLSVDFTLSTGETSNGECLESNSLETPIQLRHYLASIFHMPNSLKILCLTNLFCWMSIVSYSLYFTDFVAESVFGGDPQAKDGSTLHQLYEDGVRFGCWGMAVYSVSCALYSFIIHKLIQTFKAKSVYIGGQLVYSFGMLVLAISRHKLSVILLSCTTGIMYATVFTMPYILVAHYHTINMFNVPLNDVTGIRGIGTDVAIVSSMLFLAQFILSACIGTIVYLSGSTVAVVILASTLSLCGAICATKVTYLNL